MSIEERTKLIGLEVSFENEAGTAKIFHHPDTRTYEIALVGSINPRDYKVAFNTFLQLTHTAGYQTALFNNQHLVEDTMQSRAWFIASFLPKSLAQIHAQNYRAAVVAPINKMQRRTVEMVALAAKSLGRPMTVEFFESSSHAKVWLQSSQI